ncbi:hypothetical protein T12_16764 [Trichinella patagoniensis]|uniref:Uncharacterized protein n=1 Tax=Trichinella patagoniensis TaxID=990121 RepID=A0A0V1A0A6_9BILA|nr:hypothetical protein T12_16764 [Trichinella patagoniensis]
MIEAYQPFMFIGAKRAVGTFSLKNVPQYFEELENVITIAAVVPSGTQATDVSGPFLFCTIGVPITDCHAV